MANQEMREGPEGRVRVQPVGVHIPEEETIQE